MSYEELLLAAKAVHDEVLETATGRRFRVGVYMDCPFFIPESTGQGRADGRRAAERFLEHYNATGSLRAADYQGLTFNASYLIALVIRARSL